MTQDHLFTGDTRNEPKDWTRFSCLGFDVETTGVNAHEDRIVSAALVEIHQGQRPRIHEWLINPGVEIPQGAIDVHGITNDRARADGAHPAAALFEITGRIGIWLRRGFPLVAFNAAFDLTMLEAENTRHQVDTLASRLGHGKISPVIDPMVLAAHAEPYRRKICKCGCGATDKTLAGWCRHYGVTNVGAHGASGDALAACRLWPRILNKHPKQFPAADLMGLHQSQIGWRSAQMASLREYFDREGIAHDGCPGGWPLQAAPITAGTTS